MSVFEYVVVFLIDAFLRCQINSCVNCVCVVCDQVAAQTNHQVTLVDVSDEILGKAENRIKTSLVRVAKKKFPEDAKVSERERVSCR